MAKIYQSEITVMRHCEQITKETLSALHETTISKAPRK